MTDPDAVDETRLEQSRAAIDDAREAAKRADETPLVDVDLPEPADSRRPEPVSEPDSGPDTEAEDVVEDVADRPTDDAAEQADGGA